MWQQFIAEILKRTNVVYCFDGKGNEDATTKESA